MIIIYSAILFYNLCVAYFSYIRLHLISTNGFLQPSSDIEIVHF